MIQDYVFFFSPSKRKRKEIPVVILHIKLVVRANLSGVLFSLFCFSNFTFIVTKLR